MDLVAFNQPDADAILENLEASGAQSISHRHVPPRRGHKWGMTKSGGLAANSKGDVFLRTPTATGWENGPTVEAWNEGPAVAAGKKLLLISIDGRYCAFETEC